ncbi:hypothetical protein CsSME_00021507 [Camellia sinensis var. sinensis]
MINAQKLACHTSALQMIFSYSLKVTRPLFKVLKES